MGKIMSLPYPPGIKNVTKGVVTARYGKMGIETRDGQRQVRMGKVGTFEEWGRLHRERFCMLLSLKSQLLLPEEQAKQRSVLALVQVS